MRRLLIGLVVTATTALAPMLAFAGNQETAEQIAAGLRNSGQLHGYKIGVKFQDGTAWLRGRVTSQEQMRIALRLAAQTPGVDRVENQLSIESGEPATPATESTLGKVQNALSQTLGKLQPSGQVQPASADMPVQPLEQVSGAMAPEQLPRGMSSGLRATRSRPVSRAAPRIESAPVLAPPAQGQRVVTSFAPLPVQQTVATGTGEPTLAPQHNAPLPIAMMPQAAPRQMMPQPAVAQQPVAPPVPAEQAVPRQMVAPMAGPIGAPRPIPVAYAQAGGPVPMRTAANGAPMPANGGPMPAYGAPVAGGVAPARYDQPYMPNYAWPSYAAYPNYGALTYPKQYSPTAWPYIGPFYPYPQVPMGWRKVSLEWHDGWWMLDFDDGATSAPFSGLFRHK